MFHGGQCWMTDPSHPHYAAGRKATKMVYGTEPDMTREGGSIPITLVLQVGQIKWHPKSKVTIEKPQPNEPCKLN